MNSRATRVGTFEVCVPTHVALRKFIMRVLVSQLHFLTNRKAGLTVPLLWPVNCIKIGVHVEQPSGSTVYSLYCAIISASHICIFLAVRTLCWLRTTIQSGCRVARLSDPTSYTSYTVAKPPPHNGYT